MELKASRRCLVTRCLPHPPAISVTGPHPAGTLRLSLGSALLRLFSHTPDQSALAKPCPLSWNLGQTARRTWALQETIWTISLYLSESCQSHFVTSHKHLKGKVTVTTNATSQSHLGHFCLAANLSAARIRQGVLWLFFRCHRAPSCPVGL